MSNLMHFQQLASTNTYLEQMLQRQNRAKTETLPDGLAVFTDFQTSGRGRQQNSWFSDKGKNLLMSVLIQPKLPMGEQFRVTEWISLALSDFLRQNVGLDTGIKWPNDIYIRDRKIAGILISHHWHGETIGSSIIGIGLNLNQEAFPEQLPNPTSVLLETGCHTNVREAAEAVCRDLMQRRDMPADRLHEEYLQRLYLINKPALYQDLHDGKLFHGEITGVTEKGLLEMRCGTGIRQFELNGIAYR